MSLSKALNILLVPVKHQQCKISKRGYTRSQNGPGPSINWLWCQKYDFRNYENIEHKEVIQVNQDLSLDSMGSRLWGRASAERLSCERKCLSAEKIRWCNVVLDIERYSETWRGCAAIYVQLPKKNHLFLGQDTDIQDPYKLENLHDKWHINIVVQIMTTWLRACNAIYPVLKPDKIQLHIQLFRY